MTRSLTGGRTIEQMPLPPGLHLVLRIIGPFKTILRVVGFEHGALHPKGHLQTIIVSNYE